MLFLHNLELQNAGHVDVKKDLNLKRIKRNFCAQNLSLVIKNVSDSKDTLVHKAERPSNYFFQHFHT